MQHFSPVIATVRKNACRIFFPVLSILLSFIALDVQGQASAYTVSSLTGQSLQTITTPTVVSTVANGTVDDGNNIISLPFSFSYNGTAYTQMTVTTNGYVVPGSVPSATSTTPSLFTGTAANNVISIWGKDGNMNDVNGGNITHGAAAGDLYVIQFTKLSGASSGSASSTIYATMQIVLYGPSSSSPGRIEFVYGTTAGTAATGAQVGLRDASGSYINALGTPTSTTTASAWPASGQLYRFIPPPPCVTPSAQPTNLNLSTAGLTTVNGNFSAATPAPAGYLVVRTSSNVQPNPVNGTVYTVGNNAIGYVEVVGNTTTFSSVNLTPATQYYYWVFSYSSNCAGAPNYLTSSPLSATISSGTCSVTGTLTVGAGGTYPSIKAAIDHLKLNGVAGPVVLNIVGALTEPSYPIVLSAVPCASATNTITIRAASAMTISTANATGVFDINGGSYYIIDGRPNGTGTTQGLTISNTSGTSGPAIRFINEASNNVVKYSILKSALSSPTSGVVFFSTTTGTNGNDNNIIDNNDIDGGAGATAAPTTGVAQNGIYSSGSTTSTAHNNSGNIISNNNIFNNFVNGVTCAGILLSSGNTDWIINDNSIYQTNTRTPTTAATVYGIFINNASGNNYNISNNFIGGNSRGLQGTWSVTGTAANRMTAIGLIVGANTASTVNANKITNINFSTSATGSTIATSTALAGSWAGIIVGDGKVNINSNHLGSSITNDGIIVIKSGSTTLSAVIAIGCDGEDDVNIIGNNVAGIRANATDPTFPHSIIAILSASATGGTTVISNNSVGSPTLAQSIYAANAYTGTTAQYINGVSNSSSTAVVIENNTFSNFYNGTVPSSTTGSVIRGITLASGIAQVNNNVIRDMVAFANATSATTPGIIGIYTTSTTVGTWSITNNSIYNLSNNHATAATYVTGIYQDGPALNGTVSGNKIYGLHTPGAAAFITGINTTWGTTLYYNNTIRLGETATNATIYGIKDTAGTSNTPSHYHNTVYIGGTAAAGSSNSFALASPNSTNPKVYQNNIFINARSNSGATGKHYAVSVAGTGVNPTGLTSDYNIFRATGTGAVFGRFNNADISDLAAWRTAVGTDASSSSDDPCLANPMAATPDLHLTNCATFGSPADGTGLNIAAVTVDMDGQTRSSLSPVDIGADAGNYGPTGKDVGILSVVRPTPVSCHSATEDVIVTLKNFSTVDLDLSIDPVTVTVEVTNAATASLTTTVNTGILAAGAIQQVTVGQLNTTANGTYEFVNTATVAGDIKASNNTDNSSIVINYVPLSVNATASIPSVCLSGASALNAVGAGGTSPYTYLWDAGTTPSTAANNTGTISTTTTYNVTVTDACGLTSTGSVTVIVSTPAVTSTTAATRCGTGTVTLGATASPGATLNWYAGSAGGQAIGTGTSFTTPVISGNTNYYVAASEGGSSTTVSKLTYEAASSSTTLSTYGQDFTVTTGFTLNSVRVFSDGGTSITISLYNAGGATQLQTTGAVSVVANSSPTINLGWYIPPGTYRLCANAMTGNFFRDNSNTTYPFALGSVGTMNGFVSSITGSVTTSSSYYFMYAWNITTGCESARTPVLATVTAPPSINVTATPPVICSGQSSNLLVTSSNSDYTYIWTPGDLSGASHTLSPTSTTVYNVTATDNTTGNPSSGCATTGTVTLTVNPSPGPVSVNPASVTVCAEGNATLTALSTLPTTGSIGTGSVSNTTTTPYKGFWGGHRSHFLYTAAELTAMGLTGGSLITSVSVPISAFTGPYTFNNFRIAMKNSESTALTSTAETGLTDVFGPTNLVLSQTAPFSTSHTLSTPFVWNGTSNLLVEFCFNNNDGGGVSANSANATATTVTGGAAYLSVDNSTTVCTTNTGWTTSSTRINMAFGFNKSVPITWSPADYLNITTGNSVVTTPVADITYTATAAIGACATSNTVAVTMSTLAVSAVHTNTSCYGGNDGTITASATGGTGPYTYSLNGTTFQASNVFTGLGAGTYTVYVKDSKPCVAYTPANSVIVDQPAAPVTITATAIAPTCFNGSDGSVTNIIVTGGTGPYTYEISGGQYTGLLSGAYTITATDAKGCTGSLIVQLVNPAPPVITISNNGPVCEGTDALLSVQESYFSYSWTGPTSINNSTSQNATAVNPSDGNIYSVTITDNNGCINTASTTVSVIPNVPVSVTVAVSPGTEICSQTMVTFTATPTNGGDNPGYQWFINGQPALGETNATFSTNGLNDQDVVTVQLTSSISCTTGNPATSDGITMTVTGLIFASAEIAADQYEVCDGTTVNFTASTVGSGNSPLFEWYVNGNLHSTTSVPLFSYTPANGDQVYVVMTSSFDCAIGSPATSATVSIVVNPIPAAPLVSASGPVIFCSGGSVTLTSNYTGGNLWSTGETTDAIVITQSGTYTVTQTQLGCTSAASTEVTVLVNTASASIAASGPTTFCNGGSVTLTATAIPAATTYMWTPGNETTASITVTTSGIYSVTTTDANGCTATDNVKVVVNDLPSVTISGNNTVCTGTTEVLTANAIAGSGTIISYQWKKGAENVGTNSATYNATVAGTYTVVVVNSNSCTIESAPFIIGFAGPMSGTYTVSSAPASCSNYNNLANAITDLNNRGLAGNVTIEIAAGHTETAPAGGLVLNQCALDASLQSGASQTISFVKSGSGANPIVTAQAGTGSTDAIFAILGADYITVDGLDLIANSSNTTSATRPEYGYLLTNCSATNGAQHNTIRNATITLDKNNTNGSTGIYLISNATVTSVSGTNSYNKFYSNTISNVLSGIRVEGYADQAEPYSYYDQDNEVGAVGFGNTITNWGSAAFSGSAYGVRTAAQNNIKVTGNTINSTTGNNLGLVNGIAVRDSRWANSTITHNKVTVVGGATGAVASQIVVINNNSGSRFAPGDAADNTVIISDNTIENSSYPTTGTGDLWLLGNFKPGADSLGAKHLIINNNKLLNNTNASGSASTHFYGIITQVGVDDLQVTNNTVSGNITTNSAAAGKSTTAIEAGFAQPRAGMTVQNVTISGNTVSGNSTFATTGAYTGINTSLFGSAPLAGSSLNMANNTVSSVAGNSQTTGAFTGITTGISTNVSVSITGNTVSNITRPATLTTGAFSGIRATGTAFPSIVFNNNTLSNINIPTGTSGTFTGMDASGSSTITLTKSVSNNVVTGITFNTTGTTYMIDGGLGVNIQMNGNQVNNISRIGASGTFYVTAVSTGNVTYTNNTLNNITATSTGTSSLSIYGLYNGGSPTYENYSNNTITNISMTGAGTSTSSILYGIYSNSLSTSVKEISGNLIHSLSASTPATVTGIHNLLGIFNISKNKIYNISCSNASTSALVTGITVASGTNSNVSNNIIGDLKAPASASTDAVRGINITQTTSSSTVGLHYNTIYIDGTSSAANYGTTGIYNSTSTTATTATLDMRNNLVYNASVPKGTGRAVAYRRSSTSNTNMGPDVNNNIYYVPAGTNRHIFSNGTNHLDLVAYKGFVAPRESNSQTENVSFQSLVSSNANYLKVNTGIPTLVEGGAQPIAEITTDYFGTVRHSSSPDVGAHEGEFPNIALKISSVSITPTTPQCESVPHTVTAVLQPGAASIVSVSLNYNINGVAQPSLTMTNGGSGNTYSATIPVATPANAIISWSITASDGTYSPVYSGTSYQDKQLEGAIVEATASPDQICSASSSTLTALVSRGTEVIQVGTGTSTTSTYPYYRLFGSSKTQMLYRASELTAAGLIAGPITAIGFNITSASTAMPNVKIAMKQTASTSITGFESGMTTVATQALYTPAVGVSNHPITPFVWDGVSNLIVEYCFENNDAGGSSTTVTYSNPGFDATFKQYQDNNPTLCSSPAGTTSASSTIRPNLYITGKKSAGSAFTYSWMNGATVVGTGLSINVNPVATTSYTVTATDVNGCSIVSAPVTVSIIPLTCEPITTSQNICASGFSLTAHSNGGGAPYHYAWSDGLGTVYPDAENISATLPAGTYTFTVTITDGCGGVCTSTKVVTVNSLPTIAVTSNPVSGQVCGDAATLTATGGVSYTWQPLAGIIGSTTGASVQALPASNTTYTVTGTDANGCSNTASIALTVEPRIVLNATGSSSTICAGQNVQLNSTVNRGGANSYAFSSSTGNNLYDTTGSAIVVAGDVDDVPMGATVGTTTAGASQPIGFTFKYEGVDYTHFSASPDGWVHLKNANTAASSDFSNDLSSTDNDPTIAPFWDDMNTGDATAGLGYVKAVVKGTAPNRILVLHWYVRTPRDVAAAANSNFQALLYEGENNKIEFRYGTIPGTGLTASVGLGSATTLGTYLSVTTSNNTASTTTVNNSNAAAPAAGTMYTFTYGGPVDLEWTPAASLNSSTIPNPLATNLQSSTNFILQATDRETGCFVRDTVTITVNQLPNASFNTLNSSYCTSEPAVTLIGSPANGTFSGPGVSGNSFSPALAGAGLHTISYTVTDLTTGCSKTVSQQVTVNANAVFTACPSDIVVNTDVNQPTAVVNYNASVGGVPSPVVSYIFTGATTGSGPGSGTGAAFNTGVTTVTITAENICGPVICSFTIMVNDNQAPVITSCVTPQNVTLNGSCGFSVPDLTAGIVASDNVGYVVTQSPVSGTILASSHNQVHTITFTVTDAAGNSASCTTLLTAKDITVPVITICTSSQNIPLNGNCAVVMPNLLGGVTASDNCTVSLTQTPSAGTVIPAVHNQTITFTITAIDAAGNTATCSGILTARDETAPVITACAANQTINLGAGCDFKMGDLRGSLTVSENCTYTISQSPAPGTVISSSHNQVHVVTFIVTDAAGNTSSCSANITAKDVTAPVITSCPSIPAQVFSPANCGASVNVPNLGANDNCAIAKQTWKITRNNIVEAQSPSTGINNVGTYVFGIGSSVISYIVTDAAGLTATCNVNVSVNALAVSPVLTVIPLQPSSSANPPQSQYSDSVEFKVTIPAGASVCGNAVTSAIFTMTGSGTQQLGTATFQVVGANLEATLSRQMLEAVSGAMAPGIKTISVTLVNSNTSTYTVGAIASKQLEITREHARVDYTGDAILALPSNSNSVTFTMRANIMDITVPQTPEDVNFDNSAGDIRKAKVKFVNRDVTPNVDLSGWIPVSTLIDIADTKTGTVSWPLTITLGSTEDSRQVTVGVVVGSDGYYYRDSAIDNTILTAYRSTGDYLSGGGAIRPTASVGTLASDPGRKTNFGFNVKYGRNGGNPKGNVSLIFRRREADNIVHSYQVKGNVVLSVGVNASNPNRQTAQVSFRTNIQDITDPNNPISLGGNKTMYVNMIDRASNGQTDSVSFVLVDGGNDPNILSNVIWSSNWIANSTKMMMLNNGNIIIKSGFNVGTTTPAPPPPTSKGAVTPEPEAVVVMEELFDVTAYPNPSANEFKLQLKGYQLNQRILVRVLDAYGRTMKSFAAMPGEIIRFGSELTAGNYKVEVMQGGKRKVVNLIKL